MAKEYIVSPKLAREAIAAIIDLTVKRQCLWIRIDNDISYPKRETTYEGTKISLSTAASYLSLYIHDKDKKLMPFEICKSQGAGEDYEALRRMEDQIKKTEKDILEEAPSPVSKFMDAYKAFIQPPKKAEPVQVVEPQEEFVLNDRQE